MQTKFMFIALVAVLVSACASRGAPEPESDVIVEDEPGLLARATFPGDSAKKMALTHAPGGRIVKAEVEIEDKKLVYSIEMRVDGKPGLTEVLIDAQTGAVIDVEQEN